MIDELVKIGNNCFIGHNVVLRDRVILGDSVTIGHLVLVESDTEIKDRTTIQSQCHITKNMKIGRMVFVGPNVTTSNEQIISKYRPKIKQLLVGPTIKNYARIGARALLMPGVTIGEHAMVGAGCIITKDVGDYEKWIGPQAKCVGKVSEEETFLVK